MGGRPKRARGGSVMTEAAVEDMLRELQSQVEPTASRVPPRPAVLNAVRYDKAVQAVQAGGADGSIDLQGVTDVVAALRLSLALRCEQDDWYAYLRSHLDSVVRRLRGEDDEFSNATSKWAAASEQQQQSAARRGVPALLRRLEHLGHIDSLAFALWDLGRRRSTPLAQHPAGLAVSVARALLLANPAAGVALRQLLLSAPRVAHAWRARPAWLNGGSGLPWRRGGCLLLRLMRSRWTESVCLLHGVAGLDAADEKLRVRLCAFLHVARDLAARHMAFAIPNRPALPLLARHAVQPAGKRRRREGDGGDGDSDEDDGGEGDGGRGLVELGAHNGYWAALIRHATARRGAVRALDIAPPERSWSAAAPVAFGSAESLRGLSACTLLICMVRSPPHQSTVRALSIPRSGLPTPPHIWPSLTTPWRVSRTDAAKRPGRFSLRPRPTSAHAARSHRL